MEIKKCKLCGNTNIEIIKQGWREAFGRCENWIIYCNNCGCKIEVPADNYWDRKCHTKEQAIERWNELHG